MNSQQAIELLTKAGLQPSPLLILIHSKQTKQFKVWVWEDAVGAPWVTKTDLRPGGKEGRSYGWQPGISAQEFVSQNKFTEQRRIKQ